MKFKNLDNGEILETTAEEQIKRFKGYPDKFEEIKTPKKEENKKK